MRASQTGALYDADLPDHVFADAMQVPALMPFKGMSTAMPAHRLPYQHLYLGTIPGWIDSRAD